MQQLRITFWSLQSKCSDIMYGERHVRILQVMIVVIESMTPGPCRDFRFEQFKHLTCIGRSLCQRHLARDSGHFHFLHRIRITLIFGSSISRVKREYPTCRADIYRMTRDRLNVHAEYSSRPQIFKFTLPDEASVSQGRFEHGTECIPDKFWPAH